MSYDSLTNQGDYFSGHYLAEILPRDLKSGLLARWDEDERVGANKAARPTPRTGIRTLQRPFFDARPALAAGADDYNGQVVSDRSANGILTWRKQLGELHRTILEALRYQPEATTVTMTRAGKDHEIPVLHAEPGTDPHIVAVECGWATDPDAALDPDGAGRLREPVTLDTRETLTTGSELATFLFACANPPRYVLLLAGGVLTLADRFAWGEGRYLSVSLDIALERRDTSTAGELDLIAALFGADGLRTPAEGGEEPIAQLVANSRQHAVGVSTELRHGLQQSVELIANEVLDRIAEAGVRPEQIMLDAKPGEPTDFAKALTRESLRYLYRILFLLYAEARPDLGILPSDHREYGDGYGLSRLGELVEHDLFSEDARTGFHFYESLDLLFRLVNTGHRPRDLTAEPDEKASEGEGLRFEPLRSDLFEPGAIRLIGRDALPNPLYDEEAEADAARPTGNGRNGGSPRYLDTRLRNAALHKVLRLLMLTRAKSGRKGAQGGYISYAQLGINQLGSVYEGLMSYTGFIADEELYEVAKGGDPSGGVWVVPASRIHEYDPEVFVTREDEETGEKEWVRHPAGSFVYRLAGRDRQTSASYYTPESLTKVTVQLALEHRLKEGGGDVQAKELLDWKICEPALGSGAFLNEAINQVAAKYLEMRESELGELIPPERRGTELQKVKASLALHNCYGVDLNATAVELAEVSLWLNVMHPGLQAPWFGLHLRRGNSLIGANRRVYSEESVRKGTWRDEPPTDHPFSAGDIPAGTIHHFLLPASGWGAVAGEKEAKELAPEATKQLANWRKMTRKAPSVKKTRGKGRKQSQLERLQALAGRAEYLWDLVKARLEISEREISRRIEVWGDGDRPQPTEAVPREKVQEDLRSVGTPFWRLKQVMDAWCALWFWPLDKAGLLDGSDPAYEGMDELTASWPKLGRRAVIPLADMDDWIDFAEAVLGATDVGEQTLASEFHSLSELEAYENQLSGWMGMDTPARLDERFPWFRVVQEVAEQQGFFHWELEFGQVFARGGFDLQMGNPPWVRPDWDEDAVLAELDPWFELKQKRAINESNRRKAQVLDAGNGRFFVLSELTDQSGTTEFFGSRSTYHLLTGTRSDLYRVFMLRSWSNSSLQGAIGLIHPKTHLDGTKEGKLRSSSYHRLRLHAHFQNRRFIFSEVDNNKQFSINIYGGPKNINFTHVSWLFDAATLIDSLQHDGSGELPGIKYQGTWDLRPHRERLVVVNENVLNEWRHLWQQTDLPIDETKLLYPVSTAEQEAIASLTHVTHHLGELSPPVSSGYNETTAKENGLIYWETSDCEKWSDAVLRGPQFTVATPFSKRPPIKVRSDKPINLNYLAKDTIPRTDYRRATDIETYRSAQDIWRGRPYTDYYRVVWRRRIPASTERSLFAALIPPGPAHIDSVHSMAMRHNRDTVLTAGYWASLPLDYLLRITNKADLRAAEAYAMPAPDPNHPLTGSLLIRTLRLNCLTEAYASLWEELYDDTWQNDCWTFDVSTLRPLGDVGPNWEHLTPLRSEQERRIALVEIDALVAISLGIDADQLTALYQSRFPQIVDYESNMWFDANGRQIAANFNAYGYDQTKEHYKQLMAYENGEITDPPEGYTPPFYKADRETEMREAHAVFSARLRDATNNQDGSP